MPRSNFNDAFARPSSFTLHIKGLRLRGEMIAEPTLEVGMVSVAVPAPTDE
jgi:hypothetical protein